MSSSLCADSRKRATIGLVDGSNPSTKNVIFTFGEYASTPGHRVVETGVVVQHVFDGNLYNSAHAEVASRIVFGVAQVRNRCCHASSQHLIPPERAPRREARTMRD